MGSKSCRWAVIAFLAILLTFLSLGDLQPGSGECCGQQVVYGYTTLAGPRFRPRRAGVTYYTTSDDRREQRFVSEIESILNLYDRIWTRFDGDGGSRSDVKEVIKRVDNLQVDVDKLLEDLERLGNRHDDDLEDLKKEVEELKKQGVSRISRSVRASDAETWTDEIRYLNRDIKELKPQVAKLESRIAKLETVQHDPVYKEMLVELKAEAQPLQRKLALKEQELITYRLRLKELCEDPE